ncbi:MULTISPECIES: FecR family protein [Sphingobacterium]|uniref:FecR family protein n=1 Tax=Sphingobacterium populi TaxID=1812824 RepID=A0ABW5UEI5_9SPHI|nr:FecR domain-containing protein [Sphingobacterium sp. CFCC 11742]
METELRRLIKRYNAGQCTAEEIAWIESWYNELNEDQRIALSEADLHEEKLLIWKEIAIKTTHIRKTRLLYPKTIAAAAAAILLLFGAWFLFYTDRMSLEQTETALVAKSDIAPGQEDATLTLSDGRKIVLSSTQNGELAVDSGVHIFKSPDGQLTYQIMDSDKTVGGINTLSTANGQSFRISLPDGSLVHLNAASSISYSSKLVDHGRRMVKLDGEAYFDVASNKELPFVVETSQQEIHVLGTQFNVNAYADNGFVKTTLEEGEVKVKSGNATRIIAPGQEAKTANGRLAVSPANLEEALSWKNGYFRFNDQKLTNVMTELSRWYDIEVVYTDKIINETFTGTLSRNRNISQALNILEKTNSVKFKIEGRRIIVTQ